MAQGTTSQFMRYSIGNVIRIADVDKPAVIYGKTHIGYHVLTLETDCKRIKGVRDEDIIALVDEGRV